VSAIVELGRVRYHTAVVEFMPGKRAVAISLCVYHSTVSTVLFNAPRFIPHSFGPLAESYVLTVAICPTMLLMLDLQIQSDTRDCVGCSSRSFEFGDDGLVAGNSALYTDGQEDAVVTVVYTGQFLYYLRGYVTNVTGRAFRQVTIGLLPWFIRV
jgi:hypothetical protein